MKMNAAKMLITSIDVSSGIINNAAPRMGPKKIRQAWFQHIYKLKGQIIFTKREDGGGIAKS